MKTHIWHMKAPFEGKVNFVDSDNVVLGYDLNQCCCENAFWAVSQNKDGSNPLLWGCNNSERFEYSLEDYVFDPSFIERIKNDEEEKYVAIFKLVYHPGWLGKKEPDLFIRLENHQNGYYSHGFTFRGKEIIEGSL